MTHSKPVTNPTGGADPRREVTQPALDTHLMERVVVLYAGDGVVRSTDLSPDRSPGTDRPAEEQLSFQEVKRRVIERFERQYLQDLLRTHRGNITHASKAAQKNRRAFWELLRKHRIDARRFRD